MRTHPWPALAVLALLAVAWLALLWLWGPAALAFSVDDAWYYLVAARRLGAGEGFTFDGLTPTNGFHPLWLFVLAPLTWLPLDVEALMRVVLSLQLVLLAASTALLARAWHGAVSPLALAAVLSAPWLNPSTVKVVACGTESTLAFAGLAGLLAMRAAGLGGASMGALAGATLLARMDLLPWVLAFGALTQEAGPPRRRFLGWALVPLSAWLAYSWRELGSPVPVSASVKALDFVHPLPALGVLVATAALVAWALRRGRDVDVPPGAPWSRELLVPTVLQAGLVLAGAAGRGLLVPEPWYLGPHVLLVLAGAAWLASSAVERPSAGRSAACGLLGLAWLGLGGASWWHRQRPESYAPYVAAREAGRWVAAHFPAHTVLAGWDCGISAAFAGRRTLQLEGLMGSWTYREDWLGRRPVEDWLQLHRADVVVQPYPLRAFRASEGWTGEPWMPGWELIHARCYRFARVGSLTATTHVLAVLARGEVARGFTVTPRAAACPEL